MARFRPGTALLDDAKLPAVPVQTLLIDWPAAAVSVHLLSVTPGETAAIAPLGGSADGPIAEALSTAPQWQRESRSGPDVAADIVALGQSGRQTLWALRIFPCRYDAAAARLTWISALRVELTGSGALPPTALAAVGAGASDLTLTRATSPLLN
ncbi:MAG TPA: hypothetical protein PLG50_16210, partial [bacterium]|nr:hypothetical protein [bacterium]